MELLEALKKRFFKSNEINNKDISIPDTDKNIDQELTVDNSVTSVTMGFFDNGPTNYFNMKNSDAMAFLQRQSDHIKECRRISTLPEVANAIEELVNEATFVVDNSDVVYVDIKAEADMSDKLKSKILDTFSEVLDILNFNYNADSLFKRFYIDGQLTISLAYNNKTPKKGIVKANVMSPMNFYFDPKIDKWRYYNAVRPDDYFSQQAEDKDPLFYDEEEIIRIDSGLYDKGIILSNLHTAVKISNQLQALEDMLVPMRFSRAISRRVFNIDVGDLPYAKAMQAVKEIQDKFKYKKFYDVENGRISNSASIASIVEDYYFPNRSGGKGTTVDVLQETQNLGEMGDIEYFRAKLFTALKVPLGRVSGSEKGNLFDFSGSQIENDEMKFFAFVNKLRQRFNVLFIEMLRRQLIIKGIVSAKEFDMIKGLISIKWEKENNFIERQNIELFKSRLETYESVKDYIGDIYSKKWVLKNVLKMSDEEIEQMKLEMQEEAQMSAPEIEPEDVPSMGSEDGGEFGDNIGGEPTDDVESDEVSSEEPEEDIVK